MADGDGSTNATPTARTPAGISLDGCSYLDKGDDYTTGNNLTARFVSYFNGAIYAVYGDSSGIIVRKSTNGSSWSTVESDNGYEILGLKEYNSVLYLILNQSSTTNVKIRITNGSSWSTLSNSDSTIRPGNADILNGNIYISGDNGSTGHGRIVVSSNNGSSYSLISSSDFNNLDIYGLYTFANDISIIAWNGSNQQLGLTSNGGSNWDTILNPEAYHIHTTYYNGSVLYAGGYISTLGSNYPWTLKAYINSTWLILDQYNPGLDSSSGTMGIFGISIKDNTIVTVGTEPGLDRSDFGLVRYYYSGQWYMVSYQYAAGKRTQFYGIGYSIDNSILTGYIIGEATDLSNISHALVKVIQCK